MTVDEKLNLILQNMSEIQEDISGMKKDITDMKKDITDMKEDITGIKEEITDMKEDITYLSKKVNAIEITLENETNKNIQIIAEGHFSLDRKLDEAIRGSHDNDLYKLKVNMLDAEIKKIAQKIS